MKYTFKPWNVCATEFIAIIEKGVIEEFKIINGCPGNTQAICNLLKGMKVEDAIPRLKGIDCRARGTSCPDQIARFLESLQK